MKRNSYRRAVTSILVGAIVTVGYWILEFTKALHGFAVGMLGPAINVVLRFDPSCYARCHVESLIVNAILYALYTFIVLTPLASVIRMTELWKRRGLRPLGKR